MSERNDTVTDLTGRATQRLRDYVSNRARWDEPLTSKERLMIHWLLDMREAVYRGGLHFAPCRVCGITVACLPDGLQFCTECAEGGEG